MAERAVAEEEARKVREIEEAERRRVRDRPLHPLDAIQPQENSNSNYSRRARSSVPAANREEAPSSPPTIECLHKRLSKPY
eukprot:1688993-Pyramimonas_sp.AAC.1